ncbi:Copper resistance protein CopC [Rhodovastum atsumiense]|uniref:Copper resistance protein CopC n=1 Tax=Rhodovastum atsumiense TaxID=504468 RepID=A0A5M6IX81_9PROT|nr:copper resistance CopC family protein [Rhodovastum atsumiense]KAA5612944.1 copper resistance protein CopC [Rhodovastum atsumiense]CAH2600966.1 Copper resistance protein CopC [Rhodovastum atsumiense]
MTHPWWRALPVLAALCTLPAAAQAHAILLDMRPAASSTVAPGSVTFQLRFNSRIDAHRSRLTLTRPDRSQTDLPIADGGSADVLAATADLSPGAYTLRWQVLAIDGHITRGDIAFSVKAP